MLAKFIVIGALVGFFSGTTLSLIFPEIMIFSYLFNDSFKTQTGIPEYNVKFGSKYNVVMGFPTLLALAGGFLGFIVFKLVQFKNSMRA